VTSKSKYYKGKILSNEEIELIDRVSYQDSIIAHDSYQNVVGAKMIMGFTNHPDLKYLWDKIKYHILDPSKLLRSYILEYTQGNYTQPHVDLADYTAITMLPCEFEGGCMAIEGEFITLDVGETVIINSYQEHEVGLIESGTRRVNVAWFKKNDNKRN
tara:strand:+ start:209 stop:682 length:474 start_codon:yes stop_codon:yes gene_type:complete